MTHRLASPPCRLATLRGAPFATLAALLLAAASSSRAATAEMPAAAAPPVPPAASSVEGRPAAPVGEAAPGATGSALPPAGALPRRQWDGAVGVMVSYGPNYLGAAGTGFSARPGFYVRWGRWSLSDGGSAFITRRNDGVQSGLGVDIGRSERWRTSLGLRQDSGRRESSDATLAGLGDVRGTVRLRLSASYQLAGGWRVGGSWAIDALGRGGGGLGELNVLREWRLSPRTTLSANAAVGFADERYLQTWYGITPEQAARSGRPVYEPGAGLRDVRAGVGLRYEISPQWIWLGGVSANHLIGPPVDSPITTDTSGWGLRTGIAYRF